MEPKKRIVIISSAFFESSIPLAKYLSKQNNILFYSLVSSNFQTPPNFDLTGKSLNPNNLFSLEQCFEETHYIRKYLINTELELRIALFELKSFKILILLQNVVNEVKAFNPDLIHFIGCDSLFIYLHMALAKYKSIHTFHEINFDRFKIVSFSISQIIKKNIQKSLISYCIKKNIHLIFHSTNIKDQFVIQTGYKNNTYIPFGTFEIYKEVDETKRLNLPENSFLFFGYVRDYKGPDVFVKAIEYISSNFIDLPNFIIAGKDSSKLEVRTIRDKVHIVDKFLTDDELGNLVNKCKVVIVPHKIASQSGLPNTAFAFCKPVICSNIPGLSEFIIDSKNGLLFESNNYVDLANKIMELHRNKNLYMDMAKYIIQNQQQTIPSWETIAKMTQNIYSNETI